MSFAVHRFVYIKSNPITMGLSEPGELALEWHIFFLADTSLEISNNQALKRFWIPTNIGHSSPINPEKKPLTQLHHLGIVGKAALFMFCGDYLLLGSRPTCKNVFSIGTCINIVISEGTLYGNNN